MQNLFHILFQKNIFIMYISKLLFLTSLEIRFTHSLHFGIIRDINLKTKEKENINTCSSGGVLQSFLSVSEFLHIYFHIYTERKIMFFP